MTERILLATLRAPRRNGALLRVYSDGTLAYLFPPNPKWIPSRISVYRGVNRRLGEGENITPEVLIERLTGERGWTVVGVAS